MKAKRILALVLMFVMLAALSVPSMALTETINGITFIVGGVEVTFDVSDLKAETSLMRTAVIDMMEKVMNDSTAKVFVDVGKEAPIAVSVAAAAKSISEQFKEYNELPAADKETADNLAKEAVKNAVKATEIKEDGTIVAQDKDGIVKEISKEGTVTTKPSMGLVLTKDGFEITAKVTVAEVDAAPKATLVLKDADGKQVEEKADVALTAVVGAEKRYEATVPFAAVEKGGTYTVTSTLAGDTGIAPVTQSIVIVSEDPEPDPDTGDFASITITDHTVVVVTLKEAAVLASTDFKVTVDGVEFTATTAYPMPENTFMIMSSNFADPTAASESYMIILGTPIKEDNGKVVVEGASANLTGKIEVANYTRPYPSVTDNGVGIVESKVTLYLADATFNAEKMTDPANWTVGGTAVGLEIDTVVADPAAFVPGASVVVTLKGTVTEGGTLTIAPKLEAITGYRTGTTDANIKAASFDVTVPLGPQYSVVQTLRDATGVKLKVQLDGADVQVEKDTLYIYVWLSAAEMWVLNSVEETGLAGITDVFDNAAGEFFFLSDEVVEGITEKDTTKLTGVNILYIGQFTA